MKNFLHLLSLQTGKPRPIHSPSFSGENQSTWTSGIFKDPVQGPLSVSFTQIEGDGQADLRVHGGPDKAINVYPSEHYPFWAEVLNRDPFPFGGFGENLTTAGGMEEDFCIGDIFQSTGEEKVILQITQPRQPCWKLSRRWNIKDLSAQVEKNGRTGWYFRVLQEGKIAAGEKLELRERPHPQWTVAAANQVMHRDKNDFSAAAALAACSALSASWKASLGKRAEGTVSDSSARLIAPQ